MRAIGPTLGGFGVQGTLEDPQLIVYSGDTAVVTNDDWSSATNATELAAAVTVGAFALAAAAPACPA